MALCKEGIASRTCFPQRVSHTVHRPQPAPERSGPLALSCHSFLSTRVPHVQSHKASRQWESSSEKACNPLRDTAYGKLHTKVSEGGLKVLNGAAEGPQGVGVVEQPPSSREEAVLQAKTALQSAMSKVVSKQGRRKGGIAGQLRMQVEVPVADDSAEAQIQLAQEVCDGVFSDKKGATLPVALFVATEAARKVAGEQLGSIGGAPVLRVCTLREGEVFPDGAGTVLVIGPKEEQLSHLKSIVGTAGSRPILLINPEWPDSSEVEESKKDFVASFDVCYSFLPLNVEALLSKFEGAVLKCVKSGPPKAAPWTIFVKGQDGLKPVKTYQSRPTSKDLEDIFYNYSASQSPVTKGIGFLRGLVGKDKK